MNEFFELERKCKQLQKKRLIKLLIIIIGIILVIGGISFLGYNYLMLQSVKQKIEKKVVKKENLQYKKITQQKQEIKKQKKEIEKLKLTKKSKPISKKESKNIEPVLSVKIDLNKIKEPKIEIKPVQKQEIMEKKTKKEIKPKKIVKKKEIKEKKVQKPKKVIKNEDISFEKAIKLANLYYNDGDYQNSMKWCKIASKIDNSNAKVWKLYALNLEKRGEKDKAIKVVETYLKYRDSLELKYLLQRLKK